jgi:NAD+ kinase
MVIALFGKSLSGANITHIQHLAGKLASSSCEVMVYKPFFEVIRDRVDFKPSPTLFDKHQELHNRADILVSVGGDGTMLEAMTLVRDAGIPVMGINLGRLGFLSSISTSGIDNAIDSILAKDYKLDQRTLVKLTQPKDLFGRLNYGLNDLTITRKDSASLIVLHVYIDDLFLNSYWADGLIIATPTGSTAYSLSCGGPILTPGSANFVLTPIAPHNLTVRPIVIPNSSKIRIIAEGRDEQFLVSLDSRRAVIYSNFELVIEKAEFNINVVQLREMNFYATIREKLKWGLDARN